MKDMAAELAQVN